MKYTKEQRKIYESVLNNIRGIYFNVAGDTVSDEDGMEVINCIMKEAYRIKLFDLQLKYGLSDQAN